MKNFFEEFKKFITRGNVMDMAVGVIIGGAFTAIVNALTNNILRPIINWIVAMFMGDSNEPAYTFLKQVLDAEGNTDLAASIYIDWGAFISAIINFLLVALILFIIVKIFNGVKEAKDKAFAEANSEKAQKIAEYRKQGMSKAEATAKAEAEIAEAEAKAAEEAAIAEAAAAAEAEAKATANTRLLEEIRDLLKNK